VKAPDEDLSFRIRIPRGRETRSDPNEERSMTIFEALRHDHEIQRDLLDKLEQTEGASDERKELFARLKSELADHAAAEEKFFYRKLMEHDMTLDKARHSVAEHKELDDRVEELVSTPMDEAQWKLKFRDLKDRVLHHLEEEEHEVVQMAGKALPEGTKEDLAPPYRDEMQARRTEA